MTPPVGHARYTIIIPDETITRAAGYREALQSGGARAGGRLRSQIAGVDPAALTTLDILGQLVDTKSPQIFAESAVAGDGLDWNLVELGLLGDISIAVPVTIFDNGRDHFPTQHEPPLPGILLFTPGALLRNDQGHTPADWNEVTTPDGRLSPDGYYALYRRRLLPVLQYINQHAARPRSAFVTIPGIGCGQFAGPLRGTLGPQLQKVLCRLLDEHGALLPNLKAVYFDPYGECRNARIGIHGIPFMVRPLTQPGNSGKPQLCHPTAYQEPGDDFSGCVLYSLVAWDHVSWPGNDFYGGCRATDDGVKAAATDSMAVLTGITGQYDAARWQYQPPPPCRTWGEVVEDARRARHLRLWDPQAVWSLGWLSTAL